MAARACSLICASRESSAARTVSPGSCGRAVCDPSRNAASGPSLLTAGTVTKSPTTGWPKCGRRIVRTRTGRATYLPRNRRRLTDLAFTLNSLLATLRRHTADRVLWPLHPGNQIRHTAHGLRRHGDLLQLPPGAARSVTAHRSTSKTNILLNKNSRPPLPT